MIIGTTTLVTVANSPPLIVVLVLSVAGVGLTTDEMIVTTDGEVGAETGETVVVSVMSGEPELIVAPTATPGPLPKRARDAETQRRSLQP